MKNQTSAPLSFDEIIFEGRNKLYGAFLLRRLYNRHLILATFIAISAFMLFISIPLISKLVFGNTSSATPALPYDKEKTIELQQIELPLPEKEIPKAAPAEPPAQIRTAPTTRLTTIRITNDPVNPADEVPDINQLTNTNPGLTTTTGTPGTIPEPAAITEPAVPAPADIIPRDFAEVMPVFGSGNDDLLAYLSRKTKYPARAHSAGIQGTVYLSFTVTAAGEITDIKVLKGLGYGIDEEAIRVIKSMPNWKPGRQNGRNVPVTFRLPFRFAIQK